MHVKLPYEYETDITFNGSKVHITQQCDTHGEVLIVLTVHQFEVLMDHGKQFLKELYEK